MKYLLSLSILLFLFSCGRNNLIEQELLSASKLMRNQPDSALRIMENIDCDKILKRGTRAKYALLYSVALDKNYVDTDNDSLMCIAYRYYNKHICSDSVRFLLNYHYGRICQNSDDFQKAIRYYLSAEKLALSANKNYFLGLVYSRIGEVYYEQMNYNGMLDYYQRAYNAWEKLNNPIFMNDAMLNIANAYSCLGDNDNAEKFYATTMETAKQNNDDDTVIACLSNLGTIYVNSGNYSKALQAVKEIERVSSPEELSFYEYTILAKVCYLQQQIDRAHHYINLAAELAEDARDHAQLVYLSFQVEIAARNFEQAAASIDEYIQLSDSISRMVVSQSATAAEGKFYKEQTEFANYRLRVRIFFEFTIGLLLFLITIFLAYYYQQRLKRKQVEVDRYIAAVDSIQISKDRIIERLSEKEEQLKEFVLARFDMLDKLGRAFYERDNTKAQQEAIYKQVKSLFTSLSSNTAMKQELENVVNTVNDNVIEKLRIQFPKFKASDIDLLCYIYAGFSAQIISVLLNDSVSNIYTRKSRLKTRISLSEAPDKELFLREMY